MQRARALRVGGRGARAGGLLSGRVLTAAVAIAIVASSGCVGMSTHEKVLDERNRLEADARGLREQLRLANASKEALKTELADTMDQYEDLRIQSEGLAARVASLTGRATELSTNLAERQAALAAAKEKLEAANREVRRLSSTYETLVADLESELSSGQIQIEQLREGIRVNVSDEILFASGSANLDPIGRQVLLKLIGQLKNMQHTIEVQGHTDDRQIRGSLTSKYPTNWELASARASRVVRLMREAGIAGERLSVAAFASFRPVATNDTVEGRALNRRIEIRLKPVDGPLASSELPGGASAGADGGAESGSAGATPP